MPEPDNEEPLDSPPPLTPAESASFQWFGYIGFGIVMVSLAVPFVIIAFAIYWFIHGRT